MTPIPWDEYMAQMFDQWLIRKNADMSVVPVNSEYQLFCRHSRNRARSKVQDQSYSVESRHKSIQRAKLKRHREPIDEKKEGDGRPAYRSGKIDQMPKARMVASAGPTLFIKAALTNCSTSTLLPNHGDRGEEHGEKYSAAVFVLGK